MADDASSTAGTPAPTDTPDPPAVTPDPPEKTVPYDRFKEVNDAAKKAAGELTDLKTRLQEIEDKDKSELDRERTQRERAEKELTETKAGLTRLERSSWVSTAATEAKFIDPTDAIGRVDLSKIESASDAKREVKKIAESAKHLIQQESPTPPAIGQVLAGGQPVDPNAPDPTKAENEAFLAELKAKNADGWSRSGTGLLDG